MNAFLEQRIKIREHKLDAVTRQIRELHRERRTIEAELRAYRDVLNNIKSEDVQTNASTSEAELNVQSKAPRMSDAWKAILTAFAKAYPGSLTVDDVRSFSASTGHVMSDETLRSQLSVYTARNFLERVGIGQYKISELGSEIIGFDLKSSQNELDSEEEEDIHFE